MKRFNAKILFTLVVLVSILNLVGCNSKTESESDDVADTIESVVAEPMTEDDKVEVVINDAMTRLRYKDKSYLYEMEFDYYKDEHSFDDYLKERRIAAAKADTLEFVDVLSVEYFGDDSVLANVEVHFKGPTGLESVIKQEGVVLYGRDGEWIKPTLSNIEAQRQYKDIQDQAKKSAKSESGK